MSSYELAPEPAAPVAKDQTWRNKKTGVVTTILHAPTATIGNVRVVHKGQRTARTLLHDFVRRYERVVRTGEVGDGTR